jgi:hypothetical protein
MNATEQIDQHIGALKDWRAAIMITLRRLIHEADSAITEEWKWSTPVFTYNGMVCALGVFKDHVKVNFFQGAALKDPQKLFNAGLEAKKTRAIDLFENDEVNEAALKDLIREAVKYNTLK